MLKIKFPMKLTCCILSMLKNCRIAYFAFICRMGLMLSNSGNAVLDTTDLCLTAASGA